MKALSQVFRGKFLAALGEAFARGRFALSGSTAALGEPRAQRTLLTQLRAMPWVVYAKRPLAGPEQVLDYLGRYTHRVAISNERLVSASASTVRFRYKDYAHGERRKTMSLEALEFLRRFALHVLPRGFMRIRHYGLLANRNKRALSCARTRRATGSRAREHRRTARIGPRLLAAHRRPRHHALPALPPRHASPRGRARTPTPSAAVIGIAFPPPTPIATEPRTPLRRRRSPQPLALTPQKPSAIVRSSPSAHRHAPPLIHARHAAQLAAPAARFNSQAQPLAR